MTGLCIYLFGPPAVELNGVLVKADTQKAAALLAYMAMTNRAHTRDHLANFLWPDYASERAQHNLRRTLWALNRAIGKSWIQADRMQISINEGVAIWVDVNRFRELVACYQTHCRPTREMCAACHAALVEAANLCRGDFMSGFHLGGHNNFDAWQGGQSHSLRYEIAFALEALVHHYQGEGHYKTAITYAQKWLRFDPLHEQGHQVLIQLFMQIGRRSDALRQYETCRQLLDKEVGLAPEPETEALYAQLLQARPDTARQTQPVEARPAISQASHNLPPQLTPFIGREREIEEIEQRLSTPHCRLITILGSGGIGKTALAVHLAQQQVKQFAHGVRFVALAPIRRAEMLVPTIAESLHLTFVGRQDPRQQLLAYLRNKKMLLVLDNFEHLTTGVDIVLDILQSAPDIKIIITSRKALNYRLEWLYEIVGLSFPVAGETLLLDSYDAIQLFMLHGQRLQPQFALTAENKDAIAQICRLLEGIPLAIELATSLLHAFSCQEIAGMIRRDLDMLDSSMGDLPARHRSLRAVFDHSWALLLPEQQTSFRRLSIFNGSFTSAAASAVASVSATGLETLMDHSLLRQNYNERCEMHEVLRHYAMEKLAESGEWDEIQQRHITYYTNFIHQQMSMFHTALQQAALEEMRLEVENIRAGWHGALERGNQELIALALPAWSKFCQIVGWYAEGLAAGTAAASVFARAIPAMPDLLAQALARQGIFLSLTGNYAQAQKLLNQSLACINARDQHPDTSLIYYYLGGAAFYRGKYDVARQHYEQSISKARALGDCIREARALHSLGNVLSALGAYEAAQEMYEESCHIHLQMGDQRGLSMCLNGLGIVAEAQGSYEEAHSFQQHNLEICRRLGDQRGIVRALHNQASIYEAQGDYHAARQLFWESLEARREMGDRAGIGLTLMRLGHLNCHVHEYETAQEFLQESLHYFEETNQRGHSALTILKLGDVAYGQGRLDHAQELYAESKTAFENLGEQRGIAMSLNGLGQVACARTRHEEAVLLFRQALTLAHEMGATPVTLDALYGIAHCLAASLRVGEAIALLTTVINDSATANETAKKAYAFKVELEKKPSPESNSGDFLPQEKLETEELVSQLIQHELSPFILPANLWAAAVTIP